MPVTAVLRINGQFFAFVAEARPNGQLVAHQRAIKVGPIVGDNYAVLDGIKPAIASSCRACRSSPTAPRSPRRRRSPNLQLCHLKPDSLVFVDTFIKRPILASVCSLVIILAGAIAIPTLPIAQFPELAPPTVQVSAFYNGASAQTVETAVTTPIEQAINGVEGMMYMTSSSGNDGSCSVTVTFDINRDIDVAAVDVQNRVSQVEGRLPNEVKTVGISVTKASNNFVLAAGVYAEKGEYDALFMSNYIDRFIKDDLKRVPGVGDVIIFGERKYAMRLWLDPDRLASRGITADEVVDALREQNVQVAAGQVGAAAGARRARRTRSASARSAG